MSDEITLPFLRRPYRDNTVILSYGGKNHFTDVPALEYMLKTDGYANLKSGKRNSGFLRLSKSGQTIYAEIQDKKIRFPYGRFIGMLIGSGGYVIGFLCDGVTA